MCTQASYLTNLNPAQQKAVTAPLGAQIVVAGAGSGKTRVITARIAYLMHKHSVPAERILALTFTNKAGKEMQSRLAQYLPNTPLPFVGTFHSYCVRLLKRNRHLLPFDEFTILDSEDQRAMIKKILKRFGLEKNITPARMHGLISYNKNHLPELRTNAAPPVFFFREVASTYEEEKAHAHAFDFDDLLIMTLNLFQQNKEFKTRFQTTIAHLLVDEYQDTNQVQHELLRQMALNAEDSCVLSSICAVGDEDQSIYSWRGAQADNMQHFTRDFAPVTIVKIEQNYRSVQPILQAANAVVQHNETRNEKKLWSDRPACNRIAVINCQTGYQEADTIAQTISLVHKQKSLNEFAVLYRTHHQSRFIEEALIHSGIPYVIIGGTRFYERKEIKDLLAYLRLLVNPYDRPSFFRIINTPTRGIGDKFEALIFEIWQRNPLLNFKDLIVFIGTNAQFELTKTRQKNLEEFLHLFDNLSATDTPTVLLEKIIKRTKYRSFLQRTLDQHDAQTKLENIDELIQAVTTFSDQPEATLEQFLEEVTLMQEQASHEDDKQEHVSLMTLHAAKGLEFDTVIISGLEEELFPSQRALHDSKDLEEERRLFYVGITRAKEWLLLTRSELRTFYGSVTAQLPSRFLQEIPPGLLISIDARELLPAQRTACIAQWLGVQLPSSLLTFTPPRATTSHSQASAQKSHHDRTVPAAPLHRTYNKKTQMHSRSTTVRWRSRMPVIHESFGVGIVKKVEKHGEGKYYLIIAFKGGEKRILSTFVKRT